MNIGDKLRELRREQNMTLQQLSDKSGVALATLSRIENKRMTGTIESHLQICKALNISLPDLYKLIDSSKKKIAVKPSASRTDVFVHSKKSSSEMLTSDVLSKKMMPVLIKIEQGGTTHKEETKRGIEKFIYVLEGKVEVIIDKERYALSKNDTLYFDASLPHIFKNLGSSEAKIISIITPPVL